tara:strand:+ start:1366 stop:2400 length:1035 start_codon:yes stop_codon:yes gene_type:complete
MSNQISEIYDNLLLAYKYLQNEIIYKKISSPIFKKKHFIKNDSFPKEIQDYIKLNMTKMIKYKININDRDITINFYIDKLSKIPDNIDLHKTFIIIFLLTLYTSKNCSKYLTIDIFLTPFKRMLPSRKNKTLSPINLNGGYTYGGCYDKNEITIYREEEWFKVLIHELFHNLNLDFSTMNINSSREKLFEIFRIDSDYNVYETYCETWARILNVAVVSFIKLNSFNNKNKFLLNFHNLIKKEQEFSLIQCNKILKIIKSDKNYKENTNVLSYYVLTGVLMNNYLEFLKWCDYNNSKLLKFRNTYKNIDSFLQLIITQYKSKNFIKNLITIDKISSGGTLRMTIV